MVTTSPGYRSHYNVNPKLVAENELDDYGNPTGGTVFLSKDNNNNVQLAIHWQDGPRDTVSEDSTLESGPIHVLMEPNGAFVEDVIWAALQRLEFFNESKYRCRENSLAITKLEEALFILKDRQLSRSERGVEGKNEV